MIREIFLEQRHEKENLLKNSYILRSKLPLAEKFRDQDIIKVVIGPRRSGKSVFCILLLKDKNFAYLNFDDDNLVKLNTDDILKGLFEIYPNCQYFFFDEIQNLNGWELFVNKLSRRGYNLILTGSNAKLLSKELSSVLTGRYITNEILPFSFKEFLEARNVNFSEESLALAQAKGRILNCLESYIKNGGFPEIIVKELDTKTYLDTLIDAILFKDVVKRYSVRFPHKLYDLALYLISNFCSEFSFTKIKNILGFNSTNTVQRYVGYLQESYLFFSLNRFSVKLKEQIKAPQKIYLVDNGLITAKAFQLSENIGKLIENAVFIELLRRDFSVNKDMFYYRTKTNKEIDFVVREGVQIKQLIQVCYDMHNEKTRNREINALCEASNELFCDELLIITWDYEAQEHFQNKKISCIPLWKWLIF